MRKMSTGWMGKKERGRKKLGKWGRENTENKYRKQTGNEENENGKK